MNALAGLMNPQALGMGVQQAFQQGRAERADMETRNALSALVTNPGDTNAMGTLARYNPQAAFAMQDRQRQMQMAEAQQREAQRKAEEAQREKALKDLPIAIQLLEGSTDAESYQRNLMAAQQYGIDVAGAPPQYDPQWVAQTAATMKLLTTPEGQEALSTAGKEAFDMGFRPGTPEFSAKVTELVNAGSVKTIPYQPGGSVITYDPRTGEVRQLVQGQSAPQGSSAIPPEAIDALKRGEGTKEQFDQIFGPGAAERVMGGASSNASGGFPSN